MTKQEEIREGINRVLYALQADQISVFEAKKQLGELGVVLKVERELPIYKVNYFDFPDGDDQDDPTKYKCSSSSHKFDDFQKRALDEAGYVAVESLVENK